ncbi:Zinc finger protein ZAT1 [Linum grandiflorum]
MEKHKCRLCLKIFPNGSALGGHMRSHTINLRTSEQGEEIQSSPSSSRVEKFMNVFSIRQDPKSETEWSKDPNRWETAEPISSISDVRTTEEDLAFSLMMLSRDRGKQPREIEIDDDDDEEEDECENREVVKWSDVEKLHQCPYCDRVFSSGQALGGHKRSHFIGETSSIRAPRNCSKDLGIIDLNLPALGEGGTH